MRNLLIFFGAVIISLLIATSSFAQAPNKLAYQSVIRNSSGGLIQNLPVGIKVSILQNSASGNAVYVETHNVTTNENGLANIEIGGGNVVSGDFASIKWGAYGSFFLKTETDVSGGSNYSISATSQLLSVPYAISSGGLTLKSPSGNTFTLFVDDNGAFYFDHIPTDSIIGIQMDNYTLYVHPLDNASNVEWGGSGLTTNATSYSDGVSNTNLIVSTVGNNSGVPYAAKICDTLSSYGFSDWYLPSWMEISAIRDKKYIIGGFSHENLAFYWSSSEIDSLNASSCNFSAGDPWISRTKISTTHVRCVRRD